MLKKIFCIIIGIMMFMLILSNVVSAQVRPYTLSVTPYIGVYAFDKDQNLGDPPVYGISLGYNFTKYFGVEASGEFIATKYDLHVSADGWKDRTSRVGNYRVDGVFNLIPDSRLVPFVFAGFGGQSIDYPQNVPNRAAFAVDFGAGLKFFFTDWLALRGDVREIYVFDESRKDFETTLGLAFYFGGPKPAPVAKAEPKVEEKVMVAAAEPNVIVLVFEDIHFDFDKSTLKPEAKALLKKNIQLLKDNPKTQVRIAGYTSASGTEEYNQKLSERRANAVQAYLIKEGNISPDRLTKIGYGERNPAVYEPNPKDLYSKAAKANMRVLFEIVVQ
jgi:OOP family OmpA-OmpF porin